MKPPSRRIIPAGDAPSWAHNLARDTEKAIRQTADGPVRLKSYADAASLPAAAGWRHGLVHVEDLNIVAFSDGTDWYPLTKGAAL